MKIYLFMPLWRAVSPAMLTLIILGNVRSSYWLGALPKIKYSHRKQRKFTRCVTGKQTDEDVVK